MQLVLDQHKGYVKGYFILGLVALLRIRVVELQLGNNSKFPHYLETFLYLRRILELLFLKLFTNLADIELGEPRGDP